MRDTGHEAGLDVGEGCREPVHEHPRGRSDCKGGGAAVQLAEHDLVGGDGLDDAAVDLRGARGGSCRPGEGEGCHESRE